MSKPFGVISDLHLHGWSVFANTLPSGLNSRLDGLLAEINRCADEVEKAGGNTIICAGDVFHVRGSVDPLVLNPALETFKRIVERGFEVYMISGNHDLAGKTSSDLSSAITALREVGVRVISDPEGVCISEEGLPNVVMIPWHDDLDSLRETMKRWSGHAHAKETHLFIHAPIDGVIKGLPAKGLSPEELAALGFCRVYAGHYHNHVVFEGGKVISIGALAHHTWSDPGTRAGFLIVDGDDVRFMKSHLPEFIDSDHLAGLDETEVPLVMNGNFVRIKTELSKVSEIEKIRAEALSYGAKGVIIQSVNKAEATREGGVTASVSAGASLEVSVSEFVKTKSYADPAAVFAECESALAEVVVEE